MPGDALLALQRRFAAALREPIYGASREKSDLPPREGEVSPAFVAAAEALMKPTPVLRAEDRLELYHRQYWYRILDSLDEDFPALKASLGVAPFGRLIEAYVEATTPSSFTLRHLGAALPAFIEAHPSLVKRPLHAAELATLEYALCEAFEAAERPAIAPERIGTATLRLQPHLKLLSFRTNAYGAWRAVIDEKPLPRLRPPRSVRRDEVAVFRHQDVVRAERLPAAAAAMLRLIAETGSLEVTMESLSRRSSMKAIAPEQVSRWFSVWTQRGWLTELTENRDHDD